MGIVIAGYGPEPSRASLLGAVLSVQTANRDAARDAALLATLELPTPRRAAR